MPRILVLGGGVGGTCVARRLARSGRDLEIVVVDSHGDHLYQPDLVRVPLRGERLRLAQDERKLLPAGVRLRVERVEAVDLARREVRFESGEAAEYDGLVLATGSRLDHSVVPGAREATHHFHCRRSALTLRERLEAFRGGRIVVGAARLPYKFPPSPVEFLLLLDDWLRARDLRRSTELALLSPSEDVLPDPALSAAVRPLLRERGIEIRTGFRPASVDAFPRKILAATGELGFDLCVLVPPHVPQPYVRRSGLAGEDGWIRADPHTLRAAESVYAVGDTVSLPCPKSGSAARFQAQVAADNLLAELEGREPAARYGGRAIGLVETGAGRAIPVESAYDRPDEIGRRSRLAAWKKALFGRLYFRLIRRA